MFAFHESVRGDLGEVEVAFTDSRVDLGDAQGAIQRDRALSRVADSRSTRIVLMTQQHGRAVHFVTDGQASSPPVVDGLVGDRRWMTLVVRVADCVPVLLADPSRGIIAAAHAGRAGLAAGIVPATVRVMRHHGADAIQAWIGPHICGACYEVPEQMRDEVSAISPPAFATSRWGTASLDIGAGVADQLFQEGCETSVVAGCTFEDRRWHSFRRDGAGGGRMAGMIWINS